MTKEKPMFHPIDVTYEDFVDHTGAQKSAFVVQLWQENPTYSPGSIASEVHISFERRSELERFLSSQGFKPVYDEEAQDVIDDGEDEPEGEE